MFAKMSALIDGKLQTGVLFGDRDGQHTEVRLPEPLSSVARSQPYLFPSASENRRPGRQKPSDIDSVPAQPVN